MSNPEEVYEAIQSFFKTLAQEGETEQEEEKEKPIHSNYDSHSDKENQNQQNEKPKQKSITAKIILASIPSQQKSSKPLNKLQQEQSLKKLTHLQLNGKKIEQIDQMSLCPNLKVLYLFDNSISRIDGLNNLGNLIQLSLYNNCISKMEGLESLVSLRRLYLEKNRISRLEGLTNCTKLEEIYLSNQQFSKDFEFTFDDYSLAAISQSLKFLDISNSRVATTQPLYFLENLEVLILKGNQVSNFEEQVYPLLQTMNKLIQLDLSQNPVTVIPKYRDQIVLLTRSLQELDNKKINDQERQYLTKLVQRKQLKSQQQPVKKQPAPKKKEIEIHGKNKILHADRRCDMQEAQDEEDTQNQFYSPLDECKPNYKALQPSVYLKQRSVNINANNDFTSIGASNVMTKHVPKTMAKR